jgi:hypothetical protein
MSSLPSLIHPCCRMEENCSAPFIQTGSAGLMAPDNTLVDTSGEVIVSTFPSSYAARAANADRRVLARGVPSSQAATRATLSAVAVMRCCRWVSPAQCGDFAASHTAGWLARACLRYPLGRHTGRGTRRSSAVAARLGGLRSAHALGAPGCGALALLSCTVRYGHTVCSPYRQSALKESHVIQFFPNNPPLSRQN